KLLLDYNGPMSWDNVGGLGMLSLFTSENNLDKKTLENIKNRIVESADSYIRQLNLKKYAMPMVDYYWGSNSQILNKMIVMGYAYDITEDKIYLDAMLTSMDYILGRNALCKSLSQATVKIHLPIHIIDGGVMILQWSCLRLLLELLLAVQIRMPVMKAYPIL
ncbi:MAG: glycoside hydrolase family 9 protein, partial [Actinobacteria bacterium]|nr:glycoside hydrolase family 9 protein [Actinomycetota bacterium]